METGVLQGSVWKASPRFQVTAVAAYFADSLRSGDDRWNSLPGDPGLDELEDRSGDLADRTKDKGVKQIADAIETANRTVR